MNKYLIIMLLAVFAAPSIVLAQGPPTIVWEKTIGLGGEEWGESIAVDAAGNVYVTGNSFDGVGYNWLTVKYDSDGTLLWWQPYDTGNGDDIACAVDVDNAGNVYVVGYTPDNTIHDWRYIKYDASGTLLWSKIRDWGPDVDQGCHDIVVDTVGGYLYMTGDYIGSSGTWDYLTVKCDLDGNYISENGWSGGTGINNNAWAITRDNAGYIYISGCVWNSTKDWGTVKYDSNLSLIWSKTFDSGADENIPEGAIAVDYTGCVYLAGWVEKASNDWQIVKYAADGTFLWTKTIDTGNDEEAWSVAVDDAGFIYVNGCFYSGTDWDCRTTKFDGDGNTLWSVIFDYIGDDGGRGVVVDDSGYLYVIGHSFRAADRDFITIKYDSQTGIEEQSSGDSILLNLGVVNNPASSPTLCYTLPPGMQGSLSFYSVDGRIIEEFSLSPSQSTFSWSTNGLPGGVYFARLESGSLSASVKICLAR